MNIAYICNSTVKFLNSNCQGIDVRSDSKHVCMQ